MTQLPNDLPAVVKAAIDGIQEVKAHDIVFLDLRKIHNRVCDYFLICHGNSNTQVSATADSVEKATYKQAQEEPWHVEGKQNGQWVLMDYSNLVIHIFHQDVREFYNLEKLWSDGDLYEIGDEPIK